MKTIIRINSNHLHILQTSSSNVQLLKSTKELLKQCKRFRNLESMSEGAGANENYSKDEQLHSTLQTSSNVPSPIVLKNVSKNDDKLKIRLGEVLDTANITSVLVSDKGTILVNVLHAQKHSKVA